MSDIPNMPHTSRNCTDRQSQADSIIITLLGGERALMHMHAKHRCRTKCRQADHQIRTLGPCKQANKNRANHPPSPRLYSAAQLPNRPISPIETGPAVRQTTSAQLHEPAPSPLASLLWSLPVSIRTKSMVAVLARRHSTKKERVVYTAAG